MSALSRVEKISNGRQMAFVVASPIFPLGAPDYRAGTFFEFEVFADIGPGLERLLNQVELYAMGSEISFLGRLISLKSTISTHPGLALMRDKPTLRAVIEVLPKELPALQ